MTNNILDLTLTQCIDALKEKEISAIELMKAYVHNIENSDPLNIFITKNTDSALDQAKKADARYQSGEARALEGIPLAVKDLFCTKDIKTTAASHILDNFIPTYESTVTTKLFDAGMINVGKVNLDEFAMGSSTTSSYFGNTINPWRAQNAPDKDLTPGGSSGGSAAAIAARCALAALGTDTGGSIRQPASFCGITGIKPTYGRCSRWGIVAFASSLDQAGPFARSVEDSAALLQEMSGHDPKDSTSAQRKVPDFRSAVHKSVKGLKIGIPKEYRAEGMPAEIESLWQQGIDWLRAEGAEIVDISLPHTKYALPTYYIINPAEASSNLARYDGVRYGLRVPGENLKDTYKKTRAEGFGDEVKRRIIVGTYVLSAGYYDAYYIKAQKVRRLILNDFLDAYRQCDAILTPTAPSAAFAIGENEDDPIKMYLNDVFTVALNLAGLPGLSLPAGLDSNGLPLGLQVIGNQWDEETVFNVAHKLEQAAQFTHKPAFISNQLAA